MFERTNRAAGALHVEITLADGRKLKGKFVAQQDRSLPEVLNSPTPFVEFELADAQRTFVAKSTLQTVTQVNVTPLPRLPQVRDNISDPYAFLGVTAEATHDQVRQAYIQLAKSYHPDCYATTALPGEVCEYLSAMARHINAAYEDVQAARQKP
jgi:DnaJ-domain-containing protein 1